MALRLKSRPLLRSRALNHILSMTTADRRHTARRASDGCFLTKEQLEDLIRKVESNRAATIRGEGIERRLSAVETQVKRLCSRITNGLWAMVGSLVVAVATLIAVIWQIVIWIQKLIEHAVILS